MKICTQLMLVSAFAMAILTSNAQPTAASATFIESNKVAAAFAKGMPLVENDQFKVHASRRDAPGIAEIHAKDTDIFYLLEGSATFVTGGSAVEPKNISPDEVRAKEIKGGESRRVGKGDIIIVPTGVPHWFKEVNGPLLYYVVKVSK